MCTARSAALAAGLAVWAGATAVTAQPIPVAREHPYLFFSASDIPGLRDRLAQEPFSSRWVALRNAADRHLGEATYGYSNTREALGVSGTCAFAYAMTGDTAYAHRAIEEVEAILDAPQWYEGYTWNRGADLGTAEVSAACALVYDWCYEQMSGAQRDALRSGVLNRSTLVYLESVRTYDDWWVNNRVTNWSGVCHGGCGLAALAFYDEDPRFAQAADTAFDCVVDVLDSTVLSDGGGHEGIMYNRYGVRFATYLHTAASRVSGDDRGVAARLSGKMAGYWYHHLFGPDQCYANFNDMGESTFEGVYGYDSRHWEGGPPAALCALWESYATGGDSLLLWGADYGGAPFYWGGVSPFYLVWRRTSPKAPHDMPTLGGAVLFRGAGQAVFSTPPLWLAYNGGWTSDRSHNNRDLGSFVLVSDSERLVHDPGYGFAETGQHSTVLASDSGQPQNVRGTYDAFGSGSTFHYLASDLSACYPLLSRFVRHMVMVRGEYVVVLDDLAAPKAEQFEWRLQTRATISSAGQTALITGSARRLHVLSLAPADAQVGMGTAALDFVRITPPSTRTEETLVTLLYPSGAAGQPPASSWDAAGTVTVGADHVVFSGGPGTWRLASVAGENADDIGRMHERTLPSFRGSAGIGDRVVRPQVVLPALLTRTHGAMLVVDTGRRGARVTLVRLDGRRAVRLVAGSDGYASVPLAHLSAGIWVVSAVNVDGASAATRVVVAD